MKAWLMEHRYALADTLARLRRHPLSTLLNILVLGIALSLPLMGLTLLRNLQPVTGHLTAEPEISVFMKLESPRSESEAVGAALRILPGVTDVRLIAKEDALTELKARPGMAEVINALQANPLPDAWVLRFQGQAQQDHSSTELQNQLASQISALQGVDHVLIDSAWVQRMDALIRFLRLGLSILAASLALAIVAVIFNTIRLQVLTQRDEIEVARLMGATDGFIRRPFYYTGVLQGLAGGVLAQLFVAVCLIPLNQALLAFVRLYESNFQFNRLGAMDTFAFLLGTALLGWLGAILSVRRHLRDSIGS